MLVDSKIGDKVYQKSLRRSSARSYPGNPGVVISEQRLQIARMNRSPSLLAGLVMDMKKSLLVSIALLCTVALFISRKSNEGYHHPGFVDLRSPFAEVWSPDPRMEYGWPLTFYREFDVPSQDNASGRLDLFGFGVDVLCWVVIATPCFLPVFIQWILKRRNPPPPGGAARGARL
jgi:hypothetical protein